MSVAYETRKRWRNHTGNQSVEPLRIYRPGTLAELQEIVRTAERDGTTVRAVGSGHAWSDVALTNGYLVRTDRLNRPLDVDHLRSDWAGPRLERVQAGIRLRELNQVLARKGLALQQMGGYDAQTVAGVISTSTHGSGIALGPLPDFIHSLDVVAGDGRLVRIERADGPTDQSAFGGEIHKDDHWFNAAVVGMGCMGVVYSAAIEVTDAYWLKEVRELREWSSVREELQARRVLDANRHDEIYINPYERDGDHRCIVCTRNRTESGRRRAWDRLRRHWWIELASRLKITPVLGNLILDINPESSPRQIDQLLGWLKDNEYSGPSYKVLNIGAANLLPAYSSEIGVPLAGDAHLKAIDVLFEIADKHRRLGSVYHSAMIALRFVRGSPAYMSMMNGGETMMIELIQMTDTEGGYELLGAYEEALYELGGRPHWGQVNTLTGSHDTLRRLYGDYDRWLDVRHRLDPHGTFDSPFAKRVGISG
jgi:L-gulono-1,4-lactone dehydrogenase